MRAAKSEEFRAGHPDEVLRLFSETHRHPKIMKNGKAGVFTSILHFAPATMSGYEVCPFRSKGCTKACLNHAGFQYERKNNARINRTRLFKENEPAFMRMLIGEIFVAEARAASLGMACGVRLNGTSDIEWEKVPAGKHGNVMELFPDVLFYDYTKIPGRGPLPANYRLTFSRSESNREHCIEALNRGMNVAVVFKGDALPATATLGGHELQVIDGDEHDCRYVDYEEYQERVIVGLRAKGPKAKADTSKFVVQA